MGRLYRRRVTALKFVAGGTCYNHDSLVSDAKKQERRRRILKQRRAAQNREFDREEARFLYRLALEMDEAGDAPGAAGAAKKALHLDPDFYPALDLLARLHFAAEQFEQAISCLQLLRKHPEAVSVGYNLGQSNLALGRTEEALKNFREFLDATGALPGRQ